MSKSRHNQSDKSGSKKEKTPIAIGEAAFKLMQDHKIRPTPSNYQLWYAYVRGENQTLTADLNALFADGASPTEGLCAQVFEKHFGETEESAVLHETNILMHGELEKVLATLRSAETDTQEFGNLLEGYSGSLKSETDAKAIKILINGLLHEARSMETKSRSLESKLKESSEEIDKLKRNLETVRAEASTDSLTGIGNRKQFEQVLAAESARAAQHNQPLSVILGDVDHFKKFNDTWGHQLGDHVLKLVAYHLKTQVGDEGVPARYGGEEFAVILPGIDLDDAHRIADRIRESVCRKAMKSKSTGVTLGRITMSFGVSTYVAGEDLRELVNRADHALYQAKNNGRNQVMSEEVLLEARAS